MADLPKLDWVGRDSVRPDAADKAAGRAVYIHDLVRPGMLWGKIKFSEHASARIVNIDTSRAERLPGVRGDLHAHRLAVDQQLHRHAHDLSPPVSARTARWSIAPARIRR